MRRQRLLAAIALLLAFATAPALAQPGDIVPPASRNVTPPGITPGPSVDGPLIREPVPPPPPDPPRWRRFYLPKTLDAATFQTDKRRIGISGVEALAPDTECRRSDGTVWPCGRTALHSFRMFLRGRAVECFFPPVDSGTDVVAPCRVGQTDLGLWLLAHGWAKPGEYATDEYRAAAHTARCTGQGVWRGIAPDETCRLDQAGHAQASKNSFE